MSTNADGNPSRLPVFPKESYLLDVRVEGGIGPEPQHPGVSRSEWGGRSVSGSAGKDGFEGMVVGSGVLDSDEPTPTHWCLFWTVSTGVKVTNFFPFKIPHTHQYFGRRKKVLRSFSLIGLSKSL